MPRVLRLSNYNNLHAINVDANGLANTAVWAAATTGAQVNYGWIGNTRADPGYTNADASALWATNSHSLTTYANIF
jgi:hypothetical protein